MKKEIKWLIKKTLKKLGLYSEEASQLIFRTGMAESKYKHLRQINGPALGFFQIEPDTARDIWENYVAYRPLIKTHLWSLGFEESNLEYCMMSNIGLQIAFCRLHYRRIPTKLPKSLEGQAKYWKEHYNTIKGKGTVEHFISANGG